MRSFCVLINMDIRRDYNLAQEKKYPKPPAGLFERIVLAIKKEQEMRQSRRLLFEFFALLLISLISAPISFAILWNQIHSSGIFYFIFAAVSDFKAFFYVWQDFVLVILEAFPVSGMLFFIVSTGIFFFTLRLFLYKKSLLLKYLFKQQLIING